MIEKLIFKFHLGFKSYFFIYEMSSHIVQKERSVFLVAHLGFYLRWSLILIGLGGVSACDFRQESKGIHPPSNEAQKLKEIEQANTLTQVAGRATIPEDTETKTSSIQAYEKPFIGRYHAKILCNDGFMPCTEGTAEYILNLSEDGSVHRSIVQYGKIFTEKTTEFSNANYRRDSWSVNQAEAELIVHRKEGVDIYYQIKDQNHLVMDLEKINNGKNKKIFEQGYPKPSRAYELVRDSSNSK
ncbi:hypothetical protein [Acinetobacter sp. TSRC1-2]|uniref:hypothetical protein n=1 Tax=unclassified Acinetobacter TaxID=196816 RepID=UPI003CE99E08